MLSEKQQGPRLTQETIFDESRNVTRVGPSYEERETERVREREQAHARERERERESKR